MAQVVQQLDTKSKAGNVAIVQNQINRLPTTADLATKADADDVTAIQTQVTQVVQQLDTKANVDDVTTIQTQIDTFPITADVAAKVDTTDVTATCAGCAASEVSLKLRLLQLKMWRRKRTPLI